MYNHCSCLFFCSSVMLQWKNMLSKNQQNRVKHVEYQVTAPVAYQHVNSFLITTGVPVNYTQWTIPDSMGQLELPPLFSCTSWRRAYVIKLLYNFHVLLKHGITRIFFFKGVLQAVANIQDIQVNFMHTKFLRNSNKCVCVGFFPHFIPLPPCSSLLLSYVIANVIQFGRTRFCGELLGKL